MSQTFTQWLQAQRGIALLILIVGHTINIVLGIVAGVLHGLRLNFWSDIVIALRAAVFHLNL